MRTHTVTIQFVIAHTHSNTNAELWYSHSLLLLVFFLFVSFRMEKNCDKNYICFGIGISRFTHIVTIARVCYLFLTFTFILFWLSYVSNWFSHAHTVNIVHVIEFQKLFELIYFPVENVCLFNERKIKYVATFELKYASKLSPFHTYSCVVLPTQRKRKWNVYK